MAKAYDRLEWRFLLRTLKAYGFSEQAGDLVYRNICGIGYSFSINGEIVGRRRSFRGVRQGYPLSPLLFVLAQQIFSSNLKRVIHNGDIMEFKVGQRELPISHLLYADDVLIFSNGSTRSLRNLMGLLQSYEISSGQMINFTKSSYIVSTTFNGSQASLRSNSELLTLESLFFWVKEKWYTLNILWTKSDGP